jgi:hypothetical protein
MEGSRHRIVPSIEASVPTVLFNEGKDTHPTDSLGTGDGDAVALQERGTFADLFTYDIQSYSSLQNGFTFSGTITIVGIELRTNRLDFGSCGFMRVPNLNQVSLAMRQKRRVPRYRGPDDGRRSQS